MAMKYRRFGRTEIQMPVISVGGMRFQTSWKRDDAVKAESIENLEKIVAHAVELGLNHFETAHGYGTSEAELGPVLGQYDRDSLILQTKVVPDGTVKEFLDTLETSMKCLRADRLDLLGIHGINNDEILQRVLRKGGVLEEVLKLKEQGVIGAVGFSSHGLPAMITRAVQTDAFDYVNLWHSYIYPFNLPAIAEAARHDMGVFIISPNDKGGMLYDPPEKLCRLTAPLSPMTFNDVFILSNPNIHTISCGVAKPSDFDEHVAAVQQMDTLTDAVEAIRQRLDAEMEAIFDADWAKYDLKGVPDGSQTPEGLNIFIVVWLWNLVKAFDLKKYAQMRYNLMGNADHWFPGCKPQAHAKIDRTALRRSLAASPYADRIMDILEEAHDLMAAEEVNRLSEED
ncbi:MAG: aldo/keto reductase [Planctomycetota bacterium]|jgi:predicted aldo/keto reductase-like oxidoreductase